MDYLLGRAIDYRVARVNRLRAEILALPFLITKHRLRLEAELELERSQLAELLRTRSVHAFTATRSPRAAA